MRAVDRDSADHVAGAWSASAADPRDPWDISPRELTRPIILFSVIRALAVSIAVTIAFGLHLPNAYWMPIATIVAMNSSLEQSTLVAEQRLISATIGAAIACVCLLRSTANTRWR